MKISIFFLALFHSVFTVFQEPVPPKYNIYKESLCAGDVMQLGDKGIKFKKVVSDSRCPKNVTCVWAGEVKILIEFYEDGKLKGEKIVAGSNNSISEFFKNEEIEISQLNVYPYPETSSKILPEEYSVSIQISEKIEED